MKLQCCVASLALCLASQTAFADLVITEAVPNPAGANTLLQGMDWWELTNTGPDPGLAIKPEYEGFGGDWY